MSSKPPVYKKQNSFVEVRYHRVLKDTLPRLREIRTRLDSASLDPYWQSVVRAAIEEALGEVPPPEGGCFRAYGL